MAITSDIVGGPFSPVIIGGSGVTHYNYHAEPGEPSGLDYYDNIVGLEPWSVAAVTPITEPTITSGPISVATAAEFAAAITNGAHLHVTADLTSSISITSKYDIKVTFANGVDYIRGILLDASVRVYLDFEKPDGSRVRIERAGGDTNPPIYSLGTPTDIAILSADAIGVHAYVAGLWGVNGSVSRAAIIGCTVDCTGPEQAVVWTTGSGTASDMVICDTIARGTHAFYFHQYASAGASANRVVLMDCWGEIDSGGRALDLRSVNGLWVSGCSFDRGIRLSNDAADTVDEVYVEDGGFYGGASHSWSAGTVAKLNYVRTSHAITGYTQANIDGAGSPSSGDRSTGNTFSGATAALPTPEREPDDIPR